MKHAVKLAFCTMVAIASVNVESTLAAMPKTDQEVCFSYSATAFASNDAVLSIFNNSTIDESTVRIELYDADVGKQRVSTVVEAALLDSAGNLNGRFICLLGDGQKPLFLHFLNQ